MNDWLLKLAAGDNAQPVPRQESDAPSLEPVLSEIGAWECIERILTTQYHRADIQAAKIMCASVAAHRIRAYPPAWLMAISSPGSAKTDLLESLRGLPGLHFVDEVTDKTFISGKVDEPRRKRQRPASYLHRIGEDGILVGADFSTLTSTDPKALGKILSQLRRIYDGNYAREFGTDENLEERAWTGRLTLLVGATGTVDSQYAVFQSLGERFVRVRWPRAAGIEAGVLAMGHSSALSPLLNGAMQDFLLPVLSQSEIAAPAISEELIRRIAALTEFIALSRSVVPRARYNHEIVGEADAEGNTRLPQQLAQIGRGWAILQGRDTVTEVDFALIQRAAFDCLPPVTRSVIDCMLRSESPYSRRSPKAMVSRAIEDLGLAGIAEKNPGGTAHLTDLSRDLLDKAGVSSPNFHQRDEEKDTHTSMHWNLGEPDTDEPGGDGNR